MAVMPIERAIAVKTDVSLGEFFAARGSNLSQEEARLVGPVLVKMASKRGITTEAVVEAARPRDSVLHPYIFNRNQQDAAEEYYKEQARQLVRSIIVTVATEKGEAVATRAFISVREDEAEEREPRLYMSVEVVRDSPKLSTHVLEEARAEWVRATDKFRTFQKLYPRHRMVFQKLEALVAEGTKALDAAIDED
jgi:hypothetical protein